MTVRNPRYALKIAKAIQTSVHGTLPPALDNGLVLYDTLVSNPELRKATRQLFADMHYSRSVEEAYKCLNNFVKARSRLVSDDGASLMHKAFSPKNPVLGLSALRTTSQQDQQQGYMEIFAGCMTGIRNPRAHEHRHLDSPQVATELLALANHLFRIVESARRKRPKP